MNRSPPAPKNKPGDSPIVRLGLPVSTYRQTIETAGLSDQEKIAALTVLVTSLEPLAAGYVCSLTRSIHGQERAAAVKKSDAAANIEAKAKILLAVGEPRRDLARKIKERYPVKRSVQTINKVLMDANI